MPLLSRAAQVEVDQAKEAIEDFKASIMKLNIFINGLELYLYRKDVDGLARDLAYQEKEEVAKVIEQHLGRGSSDSNLLIERTKISTVPSRLTKEELRKQLERNVARAQDALEDGMRW
jgi:hypothetical protein